MAKQLLALFIALVASLPGVVSATTCEEEAIIAAKMSATEHEGGNLVVDKCTGNQVVYQKGRRTVVWLQVRYLEEDRRPTQWCVLVTVPNECIDILKTKPAVPKAVVLCNVIPDAEGIRRILRAHGW